MISGLESNGKALEALGEDRRGIFGKQAGTKVVAGSIDHEAHKTAICNYLDGRRARGCLLLAFPATACGPSSSAVPFTTFRPVREGKVQGWCSARALVRVRPSITRLTACRPYAPGHVLSQGRVRTEWADNADVGRGIRAHCDKAKAAGLTPVAMGTKELCPPAGWFDQMNLRINGLDAGLRRR